MNYRVEAEKNNVDGMWKVLKPVFKRGYRYGVRFIVVLIGLVLIFKEQLTSLVKNILSKITKQSNSV